MAQIATSTNPMNVPLFSSTVLSKTSVVRINGLAIMTEGDSVPFHIRSGSDETHAVQTLVASQSSFKVNGYNVIIHNDRATCSASHTVIASSGGVSFNN